MNLEYEQQDLFSFVENYIIPSNKQICLTEFFAGIGAQSKSLEILGIPFKHHAIAEWSIYSIRAYARIHNLIDDDIKQKIIANKTKEEMLDRIKGVSKNYNDPLTQEQLTKLDIETIQDVYACCEAENNFINVMDIKGDSLGDFKKDEYHIWTYSFPCQDLSLAGNLAGLKKGENTRSGLLWEIERILKERIASNKQLPNLMLLENVPELISQNFINDFHFWCKFLESIGYTNSWKILNAKEYGLPQNRKRIFMVSILNCDKPFTFPKKIKLKHQLGDLLEKNVDKKYYLTQEKIEQISKWKAQQKPLEKVEKNISVAPTLTARGAGEDHSGMILIDTELFEQGEVVDFDSSTDFRREHKKDEIPTLVTKPKFAIVEGIPILDNTKKGYKIAKNGDGVDISGRMQYHRGTVQKGLSQTITTKGGENVGVITNEEDLFSNLEVKLITPEGDIKRYIDSDIVDKFEEGQMATTTYPNGYGHGPRTHNESIALNTIDRPIVKQNLRIRKLTEVECYKLMGFTKGDALKCSFQSPSTLYHQAGDSICTTTLCAIFGKLLGIEYEPIIYKYVEGLSKN